MNHVMLPLDSHPSRDSAAPPWNLIFCASVRFRDQVVARLLDGEGGQSRDLASLPWNAGGVGAFNIRRATWGGREESDDYRGALLVSPLRPLHDVAFPCLPLLTGITM